MVLERVVFIFWKKNSFDFPGMIESWDDNAVDFMVKLSGKILVSEIWPDMFSLPNRFQVWGWN